MYQATMHFPREVLYGEDCFQKVGEATEKLGSRVLLISDRTMESLGHVSTCKNLLEAEGLTCVEFLDVATEPTDEYVYAACGAAKAERCDVIVSLGGGSCIDTGKAVAVLLTNERPLEAFIKMKTIASNRPVPLVAIPTTGGTGSEATDATVITNTATDVKMMIKQPAFMPETAIVDPLLTVSVPANVTAATGVDALTHAIETYLSKDAHPFTDEMALTAMKHLVRHLEVVYRDGENVAARSSMMYGSMLAGMAFSNASLCLVHGMSRPVGALFHVPHGISNAMLLPAVLAFTRKDAEERLAEMGVYLDPELKALSKSQQADRFVEAVIGLCSRLEIPNMLDFGINENAFMAALPKMATDALASGSPGNHPRVPSKEEIMDLYQEAYTFDYARV
ncbi:iron-containing alcohol dehydrogenase [Shouchella shacheensis]|uniref:iron-containing alcohol dehydrogenase n=1 Tax=Shouchella shacheensis TaxID=1649580 RepID=UPI000740487F|nr:iron-containing alcohol dehydrogenase [Shouchella shacheensis]